MKTFKMECLKLYKRKSTKVLISIYCGLLIMLSIAYGVGEKNLGLTLFTEGQFMKSSLSIMMSMLLPFIGLYVTCSSFALDFSTGSIKNLFLLPVKRTEIFFGKIGAAWSLIGILLSVQFVFTLMIALGMDGGIPIGLVINSFGAYLGAFMVLGILNLVGVNIYLGVKSIGITIMLTYLFLMGSTVMSLYSSRFRAISLTHYLRDYNQLFSQSNLTMLLSVILYYIILTILGSLIFEKKEESVCQYE